MVQPEIEGMELLGLVGEGACGAVFIARDLEGSPPTLPNTKWYAVRVYNAIAINRSLIENMVKRLDRGTYPKGVVPIAWKESKQGSRCMIMPMLADVDEENATIATRSLQERIGDYPEADAWPVIKKIANALAEMHLRRVAHGNLKPGNIFFDANDELFLTDFAMGKMPGVGMLPYSDALLYAPPEQLRDPDGYLTGKGYAWDTYAFAVIAFRLLTGKFPRCETTFNQVAPGPGEAHMTGIEADVIKLAERLEHRELANWSDETADEHERKRREVLRKCLSLNPEERYSDMNQVLHAWQSIDSDTGTARGKAGLLKYVTLDNLRTAGSLILAAAGAVGCIVLAALLAIEKSGRSSAIKSLEETISGLEKERDHAKATESIALKTKRDAETREKAAQQLATTRETNLRNQLSALGVTNDHLVEWITRTTSPDLPELRKPDPASDIITRELRGFLKMTEGDKQAKPVRARILMQLGELEIHNNNPAEADKLLDLSSAAWTQADIKEPGYHSRLARARLACLLQSLDKKDQGLTNRLLPKARKNIDAITGGDANEIRRTNAVMQIINGSMVENSDPAKALEHFKLALKDLEGVHKALPEHVAIHSELARYALRSASIADSLDMVDDSAKLRSKAATHLRWILQKNPELKVAKVKLAEIELLATEADMRAGNDPGATAKLTAAEKLLSGLSLDDTSPGGVSMQTATAKGLRSVFLRDQGKTADAAKSLDEAIALTKKIVAANPKSGEPLYRLAVFHWQRSGLSGDAGDTKGELNQGKQAAELMQRLLKDGAGQRDTALRRTLAYLYGNLGHTALSAGQKADAISSFKNASAMWQSLIDKIGQAEEYTEGLKWSQSRYREAGGR